ncbi:MAG: PIN domain-containing protein [Ignisphaera sp.]
MERLVLDTSVIIEYIVLRSPYRPIVAKLFDKASTSGLKLYVSTITLSEVLYIASRIYQIAGVDDPNRKALDFIEWIKSRVEVIEINSDIALRAGELKKHLHIALPDCYVIASAEKVKATPLFKRIEDEMKPIINDLGKLGVKFLDEIKL